MQSRVFSLSSWLGFMGAWLLLALPTVQADSEPLAFVEGFGTLICAPLGAQQNPWPHANGTIEINQEDSTTELEIEVRNVTPYGQSIRTCLYNSGYELVRPYRL